MAQISTNELKAGLKVEVDDQPYIVVSNEFVKPGKGQAFNRVRLKHLLTRRTIDRTFKSGEKLTVADVFETEMQMLYRESDGIVFMDEKTFEQVNIPLDKIGDALQWMLEDRNYEVIFYKNEAVSVEPPTFMEMKVAATDPGVRGDSASGRVMKPAETESGAQISVPIFVDEGEKIKIDTRTGEYVSRVTD
ncbi:MAG: elongation factor P [Waddliaceae bacterium]